MEENKEVFEETPVQAQKPTDKKILVLSPMEYEEALRQEKFPLGIIAGIVVGAVCALLWAVISVITGYQIGFMALAVGAAVGFTIRKTGKGVTSKFGVAGAIIALLSCIVGNALVIVGFMATNLGMGYGDALSVFSLGSLFETFQVIDLLFYGLAVAEGYKFAFHKVEVRSL